MIIYRILEKKGTHTRPNKCTTPITHDEYNGEICCRERYIPRYIVQADTIYGNGTVTDVKEFTDLDEARKFKRDLELGDDGIVIE